MPSESHAEDFQSGPTAGRSDLLMQSWDVSSSSLGIRYFRTLEGGPSDQFQPFRADIDSLWRPCEDHLKNGPFLHGSNRMEEVEAPGNTDCRVVYLDLDTGMFLIPDEGRIDCNWCASVYGSTTSRTPEVHEVSSHIDFKLKIAVGGRSRYGEP
ncbi:hypothetical protein BJ508DRAFT_378573 [Ascobolus immersus RN42]|uniref:Uncharacterized protein n=1 Tax=Ascobolus immersus RN42 TaxID=1160509 RepID=A0A3N4HVU4_ASCIM|nr:hypothetical protein BJ508DRAFT_378573 [Ascobolus immersus RN42]